jgi:hypothetical protein
MNRIKKSQPWLAFLGLFAMGLKNKVEDFRWKGWNIEEEFVYLR